MPRTTLAIDEDLLRRLKEKAGREGRTLQDVANELLRQALAEKPRRALRLQLRGWKATERAGVNLLDRDNLFDLMDGR
ncbi:MAG TPA: ribbon-helix-helix protein, CopG family [Thermoanaerobaculia bacterium]|nr:ribbon-helix-helix protein, CopG family [Thermoanaerobaculia bacterium]